jgi:hypothetical protein
MAHPRFGTTKRKDPLLEKIQVIVENNKFTKGESTSMLKASVNGLTEETNRLEFLQRAVQTQINFLIYCNTHGINISRGMEKWLEEYTKDNE